MQAVVNEDASGEVLALRHEIQELKASTCLSYHCTHWDWVNSSHLNLSTQHGCWDDIVEQEEVSRLRCQTLSSMQRECRRASNEFFRMSITGRDLFNAAEKDHADEGLDLKSAELLGKVLEYFIIRPRQKLISDL